MSDSTQRDAVRAMRQGRERRSEHDHDRRMRHAIAAERRLARRQARDTRSAGRGPATRFAYLTRSHD